VGFRGRAKTEAHSRKYAATNQSRLGKDLARLREVCPETFQSGTAESWTSPDTPVTGKEQAIPAIPAHVIAELAGKKERILTDSNSYCRILDPITLRYVVSLPSIGERQDAVDSIAQPLAKPESRCNVYMIVRMFDDGTAEKSRTTKGWLIVYDLVPDKIIVRRFISDVEVGSGFSNLWSDIPLLEYERSCTYKPRKLLALGGYVPAAELGLGDREGFHLLLSYTAMEFILEFLTLTIPQELKLFAEDIRIKLAERMGDIEVELADRPFSHVVKDGAEIYRSKMLARYGDEKGLMNYAILQSGPSAAVDTK
jgi:hypothetical protein